MPLQPLLFRLPELYARYAGLSLAERANRLAELHTRMRACQLCVQAGFIPQARASFAGTSNLRLMLVGQAPGIRSWRHEVPVPFSGPGGRRLFHWLAAAGFDPATVRERVYFTAITRCYPGKSSHGKGDRVPSSREQAFCAPYLEEELALVRPRALLLLGRLAIQRFLRGTAIEWRLGEPVEIEDVASVLPLPHPSGVNRWHNSPANQAQVIRAMQHLSAWRERFSL